MLLIQGALSARHSPLPHNIALERQKIVLAPLRCQSPFDVWRRISALIGGLRVLCYLSARRSIWCVLSFVALRIFHDLALFAGWHGFVRSSCRYFHRTDERSYFINGTSRHRQVGGVYIAFARFIASHEDFWRSTSCFLKDISAASYYAKSNLNVKRV